MIELSQSTKMKTVDDKELNTLINQWANGNTSVENRLFNDLYPILKKIVQREHRKIYINELNTTLLVNELYLKLKKTKNIIINDKNHLLALSARIIRFILVDSIKKNKSIKSGRLQQKVTLNEFESESLTDDLDIDFINLHSLLTELNKIDSDATQMIELRFFAGLSIEETSAVMNVSCSQISRNWKFAKAWLMNKMDEADRTEQ